MHAPHWIELFSLLAVDTCRPAAEPPPPPPALAGAFATRALLSADFFPDVHLRSSIRPPYSLQGLLSLLVNASESFL